MSKSIQLEIPRPCHEDWDKMTPETQGRFCGSCQKTVVDFTLMSDQQVLEYFSRTHGDICGRFANDQLERNLEGKKQTKKSKWAFVLNLMIPAFLISGKVYSQGSPVAKTCTQKIESKKKVQHQILASKRDTISPMGIVVDDITGKPIPGATVSWVGSSPIYKTDDRGEFGMCAGPAGENKLEISSIGYETAIVKAPLVGRYVTYRLKQQYKELESVTVTGYERRVTKGLTGTVSAVRGCDLKNKNKNSIFNKVKDSIQSLAFKKSIKLYPNPIEAGTQFSFQFNTSELGAYKVEIIDASGKLIQSEQVNVVFKNQTISISTSPNWSKGTYLIRLSGSKMNTVHAGKLVLR